MAAAQVDRGEGKENGAPKEEPKEEEDPFKVYSFIGSFDLCLYFRKISILYYVL